MAPGASYGGGIKGPANLAVLRFDTSHRPHHIASLRALEAINHLQPKGPLTPIQDQDQVRE